MDLVSFFRRIRMHGIGLTMLLSRPIRTVASKVGKRKALESVATKKGNMSWNRFESLCLEEKIVAGILARYH
jgi:hypothetical protein